MLLGMKPNNTETRAPHMGAMLESSGPTTLQMCILRPRERKGLCQGCMVAGQWKS